MIKLFTTLCLFVVSSVHLSAQSIYPEDKELLKRAVNFREKSLVDLYGTSDFSRLVDSVKSVFQLDTLYVNFGSYNILRGHSHIVSKSSQTIEYYSWRQGRVILYLCDNFEDRVTAPALTLSYDDSDSIVTAQRLFQSVDYRPLDSHYPPEPLTEELERIFENLDCDILEIDPYVQIVPKGAPYPEKWGYTIVDSADLAVVDERYINKSSGEPYDTEWLMVYSSDGSFRHYILYDGILHSDRSHGAFGIWNEGGELIYSAQYRGGVKSGQEVFYNIDYRDNYDLLAAYSDTLFSYLPPSRDGVFERVYRVRNGVRQGKFTYYNESGQEIAVGRCKDDREVSIVWHKRPKDSRD